MSQSFNELEKRIAIRSGSPVPLLGLTFYPITMLHYEEFLACKDAIILRMTTLPVKYMSKDYLSAIFAFELDSIKEKNSSVGLFQKALRLFQLSLRINENILENRSIVYEEKNGEIRIKELLVKQNGNTIHIKPFEFSTKIRQLIAEQNGLKLPDESENLDLVLANEQRKRLKQSNVRLDENVEDLIASVAYQSKCREQDVLQWTVREFELRKNAIDRDKNFMLYGQAEMSGMVTFKKGNPAPSWYFDILDDSLGTMSLSELSFGNTKQKFD